ncbi:hypothetical protein BBbe_10290, partial [Bartonella bovis 91-4]
MWVMVMRCVFKHHVYLCVVSTALMAGLALTSHTSKAYAQAHNCGSGRGVGTVSGDNKPIVCDSRGTRILSSSRGGDINIDMDEHSREEAAVTVKNGADITIIKKLKVINGKGSGKSGSLPVIKVSNAGKLMLNQEVNVEGAGVKIKKEIVVDGSGSSVTLNGVLKGFERGEVKVSNEGMVVLGEGVKGIEEVKVKINDGGGTVRFDGNVTFNNGSEAGIQITGNGAGKATVMGVGKAGEMVTMTVNGKGGGGDGVGIQMDGAGTADVMRLKIKGSGGMGVRVQNETGTMTLNMVNVSGFTMGVNARSGTVDINGDSKIEVGANGTGIMVSGSGATVKMMGGKIEGKSGGNFGVQGSGGTVMLTSVGIEGFGKGVDMQGGTLKVMGGTVTFEGGKNNYGMKVGSGVTMAELTSVTIEGKGGNGEGKGVIMGGTKMTMNMVNISQVKVGVEVKKGTVNINMGEITFESGNGNYGVHVQNGATANITGATIRGTSGQGTGLYVMGTGSASMMGGTISNVESGVYATGTGNLTINGGTTIQFKNGNGSYGVKVQNGANADLTNVTIKGAGSGKGVWMDGRGTGATGTLNMTGVRISDVAMGVEATGGNLTISGGTNITFKNGDGNYGVRVGSGVTMATLTDVVIKGGGKGKGVIKDGTGEMTMTNGSISNVELGIQVTSGNLTVNGGTMTGVQTGITMSGSGTLMVNSGARIEFTGEHGVKVESGVTSASLTDVRIVGGGSGKGTGVIKGGVRGGMDFWTRWWGFQMLQVGVEATAGRLEIKGN